MGAVYEAVHRDLKKRVAIKVLSTALAGEEAKQRFLREGEAASRIQHPNVVDIADVGTEGSLSYLVMEFLEGEDLAHRLARQGAMPPREIADILLPVCAGLAVAHDEGVVHRDLKPENIFLVRQRGGGIEPKVLDFGISKLTGRDAVAMTGTLATFGTPYYMPPEQVRGARQADQRSDVYALGVVLYECSTGRRPFEAENIYSMLHAIGAGEYPAPRIVKPGLPLDVEAVIVRAMQLEPANRFPTVRHLAAALLPFASDKARMLWSETFGAVDTTQAVAPTAASTPPVANDAAWAATATPAPGQGPLGSKSWPSTTKGTTLGSATGHHLETVPPPPRSRLGAVVGGAVALGAVILVGAKLLRPTAPPAAAVPTPVIVAPAPATAAPPTPRATYRVEVDADPATATMEVDGVATGARILRRDFPIDGREHRLVARAPGYRDEVVTFIDAPPDRRLSLDPVPAPGKETASSAGAHPHAHHHPKASSPAPASVSKPAAPPAAPEKPASKNGVPVID